MPVWLATLLLVGVTAVWGWTFVVVRDAIAHYGVLPFLALRFLVAGIAVAAVWWRHLDRRTLRTGAAIGLVLVAGYLLQTFALSGSTATNVGLITGLFVVFAPIAARGLYGTRLGRAGWAAVALSLGGMSLLSGGAPAPATWGDLLALGCAVAFGLHVALLSRHSPHHDARGLTAAQLLTVAAVCLALWPLSGPLAPPPREVWGALAITGLLASAAAYWIQTAAQRTLSAARTAVILTMEPVFAALFGFWLAGERLVAVQLAGATLILGAVAIAELAPRLTRDSQIRKLKIEN